jgi:IMP dehydrogenase
MAGAEMRDVVEIGLSKSARRGYHLDDIAIVPTRRTRDVDDVSTNWQLDAYPFKIPCVAHPSDAIMSPATAVELGRLGGLGVLNVEGLWTRYTDPSKILEELSNLDDDSDTTRRLQEVYAEPIKPELIVERVKEIRDGGVTVAVRVSPQHTLALAPVILDAGVDLLVIQGTLVSAEHVSTTDEPLNLKEFIADLDLPVIVGGCTNYQTALHLMRTGAAGVIVGIGADEWSTTDRVLGIRVPMATAIADAADARRDYLDETGGR